MRFSYNSRITYLALFFLFCSVLFLFSAIPAFAQGQIGSHTISITERTHNSATINFHLFLGGTSRKTNINIYYGTDPNSLTESAFVTDIDIPIPSGIPLKKQLSSLTPGTTYYFTIKNEAVSPTEVYLDPPLSFPTLPPPPVIKTFSATKVETKTATLKGSWSTAGYEEDGVDTIFEYGTLRLGNKIFNEPNDPNDPNDPATSTDLIARGVGQGSMEEDITGLTPNTKYYFKALGTNDGGDSEGLILNFITKSDVAPDKTCEILSATFNPSDDTNPPPKTTFMSDTNQPEVILTVKTSNCESKTVRIRIWEKDSDTDEGDNDLSATFGDFKIPSTNELEIKLRAGDFRGDLSEDPDASYYVKITGSSLVDGIKEFSSIDKINGSISYDCDGTCGKGWKVIGETKWWFKKVDFNQQVTSEGPFDSKQECETAQENIILSGAYGTTIASVGECTQVNSSDEIPDASLTGECSVVSAEFSPAIVDQKTFFKYQESEVRLIIKTINCEGQDLTVALREGSDNVEKNIDGFYGAGLMRIQPVKEGSIIETSTIRLLAGTTLCNEPTDPDCQYHIRVEFARGQLLETFTSEGKTNGQLEYDCGEGFWIYTFVPPLYISPCTLPWELLDISTESIGSSAGDVTFDLSGPYKLLAPLPDRGTTIFSIDTSADQLGNYFNLLFRLLIGIAGVLAVIMIVLGGIQYMMEESILAKGEAKKRITSAILGLILALGAYAILFTLNPNLVNLTLGLRTVGISLGQSDELDKDGNCAGGKVPRPVSLIDDDECKNCQLMAPEIIRKDDDIGDMVTKAIHKKLLKLNDVNAYPSGQTSWVITEAFLPEVPHCTKGHYNGSVIDVGLMPRSDNSNVEKIVKFAEEAGKAGFRVLYESASESLRDKLEERGVNANWYSTSTGAHFHLY